MLVVVIILALVAIIYVANSNTPQQNRIVRRVSNEEQLSDFVYRFFGEIMEQSILSDGSVDIKYTTSTLEQSKDHLRKRVKELSIKFLLKEYEVSIIIDDCYVTVLEKLQSELLNGLKY